MNHFHAFEDRFFGIGDRLSEFLYDLTGWQLRGLVLWAYVLFNGPMLNLLIAGDRIDSMGEWFSVGITVILGLTTLHFLRRFTISTVNTYVMTLRSGPMMMLLRVMAICFLTSYVVALVVTPKLTNIGPVIDEAIWVLVHYWAVSIVPERPRRKRRLLPRLKLFDDPLPRGAT